MRAVPHRFMVWTAISLGMLMGPPSSVAATTRVNPIPPRRQRLIEQLTRQGKEALAERDVALAYRSFARAQRYNRYNPRNAEANFYVAITRILSWPIRHSKDFEALSLTGPKGRLLTSEDLNPLRFMAVVPAVVTIPTQFSQGSEVQQYLTT